MYYLLANILALDGGDEFLCSYLFVYPLKISERETALVVSFVCPFSQGTEEDINAMSFQSSYKLLFL